MKRAALLVLLALVACEDKKKDVAPTPPPSASAMPSASVSSAPSTGVVSHDEGQKLVDGACLSCHTDEMLAQQRIGREKWAAEVKKMAGWGANLDPADEGKLVSYLADHYGPDAGAYEAKTITAGGAKEALEPQADGPYANGDAAAGAKLYADKCQSCHGPDARSVPGALGIALVEKPILRQANAFATMVRKGRGKMIPVPTATDKDVADLLAHLRVLKLK